LLQLTGLHRLVEQLPLAQSLGAWQAEFAAHGPQLGPPQSTSLSSWFRMPSPQLAALHRLAEQLPLAQSLGSWQRAAAGQGPQSGPPHSLLTHVATASQRGQVVPPQSV